MSSQVSEEQDATSEKPLEEQSFFENILTPGSSLHPTFLFIVDFALAFLAMVFISLAVLTSGNVHFYILLGITLALWGSIKWFVYELQNAPPVEPSIQDEKKDQ
ncbi:unnamed protein product [Peniophora sp. CBMAI 1063]|nr:unnamed protein product [Peniophora sp. CBMAI 1063]